MGAWPDVAFADAFEDVSSGPPRIRRSRYLSSGALPVVDQGRKPIAGYVEDRALGYRGPLPVLLFGDHTRQVKYVDFPFAVGADGVKVLRARPGFAPRYLYHALRALEIPSAGYSRHFKFLREAVFRAPPAHEQRRVAGLLDDLDTLRDLRRESLSLADELARATFLDLFGDPADNPRHWPTVPLGTVAEFFAGTTLPDGVPHTGRPDGYLLLKVGDLDDDTEITASRLWSPHPGTPASTCPAGCVVIPKRGGAIATNKKRLTTRPSVLDPNLMAIRPHGVTLAYLLAWLRTVDLTTLTTGSSVPQLNKKDLTPLPLTLPPARLQREFAAHTTHLTLQRTSLRTHLTDLENLTTTLRHQTFHP